MSELNVYHHELRPNEYAEFYLKYEADKVIAEKDKEIAKLKESIGKLLKSKTEQIMNEVLEKVIIYGDGFVPVEHAMKLVAELRHNKYKRCLAMAQWCMDAECKTEKDADFLVRWEYRWLALAEEPTWAKFLQLIHKEAK